MVIQYSPYNGGHGNIMWFANKEGYDIPVISAGDSFKAVSVQELIWRIRMKERKEQTLKYLKTIK